MWFAGELVGRINEIVDSSLLQFRIVNLFYAVRNPVHDEGLGPMVPQWTVYLVRAGVDRVEGVLGGRASAFTFTVAFPVNGGFPDSNCRM